MLQARGHKVTGSDQNVYPPMSTQLEALGIEILNGYRAENANIGVDCVTFSRTIRRCAAIVFKFGKTRPT